MPVIFSLGNGLLGIPGRFHSGRPPYGLVAVVDMARSGPWTIQLRLLHVDNAMVDFQPRPVAAAAASEVLWQLVHAVDGWIQLGDGSLELVVDRPPGAEASLTGR